jgi:hypothetical protein
MFCIDTSSLIHAWRRDYPPDVFEGVWRGFEQLISEGLLVSPEEVLLELERGGDELYSWANERRHMFIQPDQEVQDRVRQVVNQFDNFLPQESQDGIWADPYVIALAQSRGLSVVTGEILAGRGARTIKIPNVCQSLNVDYLDVLGMLRAAGLQF